MINYKNLPLIKQAIDHNQDLHKLWDEVEGNHAFFVIEVNGERVRLYIDAHKGALAALLQKADIDSLDELRRLNVNVDGNSRICKL